MDRVSRSEEGSLRHTRADLVHENGVPGRGRTSSFSSERGEVEEGWPTIGYLCRRNRQYSDHRTIRVREDRDEELDSRLGRRWLHWDGTVSRARLLTSKVEDQADLADLIYRCRLFGNGRGCILGSSLREYLSFIYRNWAIGLDNTP